MHPMIELATRSSSNSKKTEIKFVSLLEQGRYDVLMHLGNSVQNINHLLKPVLYRPGSVMVNRKIMKRKDPRRYGGQPTMIVKALENLKPEDFEKLKENHKKSKWVSNRSIFDIWCWWHFCELGDENGLNCHQHLSLVTNIGQFLFRLLALSSE